MSVIYLFRHGQASWGQANYDQLSSLGQEQSRLLGAYCRAQGLVFEAVFQGSLVRHQQTLDAFGKGYGSLPTPQTTPLLNEHHGPAIQDTHLRQAIEQDPTLRQRIEAQGTDHPLSKKEIIKLLFRINVQWAMGELDSGPHESWSEFRLRMETSLRTLRPALEQHRTVGIFTSGGVVATWLGMALGLDDRTIMETNWQIRNASFTELHYTTERMYLRSFNAVPHLDAKHQVTYV
jgi:broad specificity phosphatase PhoE